MSLLSWFRDSQIISLHRIEDNEVLYSNWFTHVDCLPVVKKKKSVTQWQDARELFWWTDYPNRPHPSPSFTLASPPHMASITAEWGSEGRRSTHALLIDVTPGLRNFNTAKKCWAFLSSINTEDGLYRRGKYPNTVHTFAKKEKKGWGKKTGLRLYISNTKNICERARGRILLW